MLNLCYAMLCYVISLSFLSHPYQVVPIQGSKDGAIASKTSLIGSAITSLLPWSLLARSPKITTSNIAFIFSVCDSKPTTSRTFHPRFRSRLWGCKLPSATRQAHFMVKYISVGITKDTRLYCTVVSLVQRHPYSNKHPMSSEAQLAWKCLFT